MAVNENTRSVIMAVAVAAAMLFIAVLMAFVFAFVMVFWYMPSHAGEPEEETVSVVESEATSAYSHPLVQQVGRTVADAAPDSGLSALVVGGRPATRAMLANIARNAGRYTSQVEAELQHPDMPSGCEIVSLAIALRAEGFAVKASEIADEHLEVDGTPRGYLSSPYDYGGGGLPSGIARTANSFLRTQGSTMRAYDLTGTDFAVLERLTEAGYPVLVWVTEEFAEPYLEADFNDETFWYWPEHCVVLYGGDGASVALSDPLVGYRTEKAELVEGVYTACGSHALAVF